VCLGRLLDLPARGGERPELGIGRASSFAAAACPRYGRMMIPINGFKSSSRGRPVGVSSRAWRTLNTAPTTPSAVRGGGPLPAFASERP